MDQHEHFRPISEEALLPRARRNRDLGGRGRLREPSPVAVLLLVAAALATGTFFVFAVHAAVTLTSNFAPAGPACEYTDHWFRRERRRN